jgi:hypothetical protein
MAETCSKIIVYGIPIKIIVVVEPNNKTKRLMSIECEASTVVMIMMNTI